MSVVRIESYGAVVLGASWGEASAYHGCSILSSICSRLTSPFALDPGPQLLLQLEIGPLALERLFDIDLLLGQLLDRCPLQLEFGPERSFCGELSSEECVRGSVIFLAGHVSVREPRCCWGCRCRLFWR